ncbi:MAG: adenosylcobinamide-phosphate synthase CbiB [Planctomycetes bacterium]|nr:adenosylcobinamide-phosphate synthase CbiB [Planctomycetota bacterium]
MAALLVLSAAFLLDLLCGDPRWLPHTVVAIGRLIERAEAGLRRLFPATPTGERLAGTLVVLVVVSVSCLTVTGLRAAAATVHPGAALAVEVFFGYQALATTSLRQAAGAVLERLQAGDLAGARTMLSHIVGRDTAGLDAPGIVRATVETVAENTSDGVLAPMLYLSLGGAPLAIVYKAINTMDSMLGYRNDTYRDFGWAAARLDDSANFLPARITALLMIPAAWICGLDGRGAWRIFRRDRHRHTSPNAGQPEAAGAGALGIQLGGPAVYGGRRVEKPTLGDAVRPARPDAILRALRLMQATVGLGFLLCCAVALARWRLVAGGWPWR